MSLSRHPVSFRLHCAACICCLLACTLAWSQDETYSTPPESEKQEGVPEGRIEGPFDLSSRIFAGTTRQYWVYVPEQYQPDKPACTLIVQDGLKCAEEWRLPQICDNLIHAKEMPVTIGIFVSPGEVKPSSADAQPRFNRSFEYDSLGDRYARFLLEELIPEVIRAHQLNLSTDPNHRAIAGASSGGICAFNVAWERPNEFRRVLSTIGTFVGLRGGNEFPTLVRKTEPKPLRVFLQDGSHDLNLYAGDWWIANQDMLSALVFAGYDVKHVWGTGGHNGRHAAAIMPDALRWLWRDYPEPIKIAPNASVERRVDVLMGEQGWQSVSSGHALAEAPACNAEGELFFCDSKAGRIYRVGEDSKTRIFADQAGRITSLSFGPDGSLYAIRDDKHIVRFDAEGKETLLIKDTAAESLKVLPSGIYYTDPVTPAIHRCTFEGGDSIAMPLRFPASGLAPTADHAFLQLVGHDSQFTMNCKVGPSGELEHRQEFGYLHLPYGNGKSQATDIVMDRLGRAYVTSGIGVQVLDQLGRVNLILSPPSTEPLNGLSFGGAARQTLFVTAGDSVFRRELKTQGCFSFEPPVVLPRPNL